MPPKEQTPFSFDLTVLSGSISYVMENAWNAVNGAPTVDFLLDLQVLAATGGATPGLAIRPALQYAPVRTDRPDDPFQAGPSDITTATQAHVRETLSAASKFWFRRGVSVNLTGTATFGRAQGLLYTAWRSLARVLPAEEIVIQPYNASVNDVSVFPLGGGRPNPANEITSIKMAVSGMGNAQTTLTLQPAVRFYNDPLARGEWTLVGSSTTPSQTNFSFNTTDVGFGQITPANFQWFDVALAAWKSSGSNSRAVLRVVTSLKYA